MIYLYIMLDLIIQVKPVYSIFILPLYLLYTFSVGYALLFHSNSRIPIYDYINA